MKERKRLFIQAAAALLTNSHLSGFFTGGIYRGAGKQVCVPGLNCYSCPGAVGSCPIGALQNALSGRTKSFPYYVVGFLLLFGATLGRLVCGFLCPFGLVQDLLHKLPGKKRRLPPRLDKALRWGKYCILVGLVILAPLLLVDAYGVGAPAFCKYLCPAGTLEGGLPLLLANETLRQAAGWLFGQKLLILAAVLAAAVLVYRPFCKYLCPLGAIYGLCNHCSLYRQRIDPAKCTGCAACVRACPMQVDVLRSPNSAECIRCGKCRAVCPTGALQGGFSVRQAAAPKPADPPA